MFILLHNILEPLDACCPLGREHVVEPADEYVGWVDPLEVLHDRECLDVGHGVDLQLHHGHKEVQPPQTNPNYQGETYRADVERQLHDRPPKFVALEVLATHKAGDTPHREVDAVENPQQDHVAHNIVLVCGYCS